MRDTTTKYQVRVTVPGRHYSPASWHCKRDGRPTGTNLREYVERFEASTQPGGVNAHLGIEIVASARILLNDGSGTVVTEYIREVTPAADMFVLITEIV
jgi:hypothetical protein